MSTTQELSLDQLCIQIHPGRTPALDLRRLKDECESLARGTQGIRGVGISEGDDEGLYLNIVFAAEDPIGAWHSVKPALLESSEFGSALKASCLCVCTGKNGWDDYLLLYHFDPTVAVDEGRCA